MLEPITTCICRWAVTIFLLAIKMFHSHSTCYRDVFFKVIVLAIKMFFLSHSTCYKDCYKDVFLSHSTCYKDVS